MVAESTRIRTILQDASTPLNTEADLDPLIARIGDAQFVLLGESTHGTSEFYTWRTRISQRLIAEKGFDFVAVEGDWPDCFRVNRYIKGFPDAGDSAFTVLNGFERWPTWMWANREVVHLADWLRRHNERAHRDARVGFYGLDVYSLWESMDAVLEYLRRHDPGAIPAARRAYACFDPFTQDEHRYARATALVPTNCEREVVAVLSELRRRFDRRDTASGDDDEARFDAEQNALIAVSAERYYRAMVRADDASWNVRDTHMADTLDRLVEFHQRSGRRGKAIVWAHNTHLGDARATDMAAAGLTNLGQLVRERHSGSGVVIVGTSAYQGHVIAAPAWGDAMEVMPVPPATAGSWDELLHVEDSRDIGRLLLLERIASEPKMQALRGQRAIGVVYRPPGRSLFLSAGRNDVPTLLPRRYDALIHFDDTRALHPLHAEHLHPREIPETYPSGM
jgi:erythromycin esterase